MLLKTARTYWGTVAGGIAIIGIVAVGAVSLSTSTTEDLVRASAKERVLFFADYLASDPVRLNALMSGISRQDGLEAELRTVASLSGISSFSLFEQDGREAFSTRSDSNSWLLRDRPGGLSNDTRISDTALGQIAAGGYLVDNNHELGPAVSVSIVSRGVESGFLRARVEMGAERNAFAGTLGSSALKLLGILLLSTGIPALIFVRRKRLIHAADERILYLANYDGLTNILNRKRMQEETDQILAIARATREHMAFWFVDVNSLGEINDSLGEGSGDLVLKAVANRLADVIERNDLLSRIGSDDFAILQRDVDGEEKLAALSRRIASAMATPIDLGNGQEVQCNLTLGAALAPEHGRNSAELIKHAELAFLHQKGRRGDGYMIFHTAMDEELHQRREVERRVQEAIDNDGFELFYQPIVCGLSEELVGFEALIRLPDGQGGYIPPSTFIPIAEGRESIKAIGNRVIFEACRQAALWPDDLFVSLNLSPLQFRDGDLVSTVRTALAQSGIEGRRIEIEVVESLLMERSDEILGQLGQLKSLGISVDMDDFGTGYSSLGYLWRFPFDKLKIDRSFVSALDEDRRSMTRILETIVSLAHHLGLKVTAEGIETAEQAEILRSLGCDQLQGFYFGRPMPAQAIGGELLRTVRSRLENGVAPSRETLPADIEAAE